MGFFFLSSYFNLLLEPRSFGGYFITTLCTKTCFVIIIILGIPTQKHFTLFYLVIYALIEVS